MAISSFKSAAGRLSFQTGMSDRGKVQKRTKTYQNIAKDLAVDDFHTGLAALANLSSHALLEMERVDTSAVRDG